MTGSMRRFLTAFDAWRDYRGQWMSLDDMSAEELTELDRLESWMFEARRDLEGG